MNDVKKIAIIHQQAVARLRRTILQFDIFGKLEKDKILNFEDFLSQQFEYIENAPFIIDSFFWDMMYNGDEYAVYPSKVLLPRTIGYYLQTRTSI